MGVAAASAPTNDTPMRPRVAGAARIGVPLAPESQEFRT